MKPGPIIRRVDANQKALVAYARSRGFSVVHIHTIGHGCPDLLCGRQGESWLIEVKQPGEKLTPDEVRFWQSWQGAPILIWRTIADIESMVRE